ncbi:ROK family protein [Sporolactobacillus pectinivorans]|uniref:ROK family protein n=1 Tax=Sporolactobacillus pectinivorans TaxID=1591408 RepID=UPI000C268D0E|nr:ROK family protein [Sporolactobacillus pectinivorans]
MYLGGIEAGGTKFVCAVGDENGNVLARERIATTDTKTTLSGVVDFFKNFKIEGLGIGSFGPVDLNRESPTYGYITSTPKQGWTNYPLVQTMEEALHVPVGLTTDVNAAALGELYNGAAKGLDGCLYITVGTGIGAGLVSQNRLLQGLSHPEMGHILLRRHPDDDFEGICPYHHDCLEGLASGPALEARWGKPANELPVTHKAWEIEADYLAQALMQYVLIVSPKKIIIGGGVMKQTQLFPKIREKLQKLLAGYIDLSEVKEKIDEYIIPPALGDNAGITGALILGSQVLKNKGISQF